MQSLSGTPDIVVIGGSSGAFGVVRRLLAALPSDFPAAVLVCVHIAAGVSLTKALGRNWPMALGTATDGAPLEAGHLYLAVADSHLMLHDGHLLLRRGPRENRSRPSIDVLFRSAACTWGNRVIGVLLSGYQNDGVAGLVAIKRCGGRVVVQDPEDTEVSDMADNALRAVRVDHTVSGGGLGELLQRLVHEPVGPLLDPPVELKIECAIAAQEMAGMDIQDAIGARSPFTCPECDGALWEVNDADIVRYRCHVGHAITGDMMLDAKTVAADETVGRALRIHRERGALCRRLSRAAREKGQTAIAASLDERAAGCDEDAEMVQAISRRLSMTKPQD